MCSPYASLTWAHPSPHPKQHLDRFSRFRGSQCRHRQTDRQTKHVPMLRCGLTTWRLVQWPLMDGTAKRRVRGTHLPTTQSPPHCTKRYSPPIDGRCTNIALHWYLNSCICTYVTAEKLILVALRSHFSCAFVLFYFADEKKSRVAWYVVIKAVLLNCRPLLSHHENGE